MSTTTVSARMDGDLKAKAEAIMATLGISHSMVINALYSQIVLRNGVPFDICIPAPADVLALCDIRKEVRVLAERYGFERAYLFGSYARGEARPESDVDIRVDKGSASGFALGGFQYDLSRALGREVDVVSTSGADAGFLERIAKDEVLLYER